ncbi:hypothetical protein HNQ91_003592 [Filimonas zeae]|nr:outer membrane beta-barrel protein [Filimonas zeae]MDR6340527.1 hypothetical protein [Filimonas zeae]
MCIGFVCKRTFTQAVYTAAILLSGGVAACSTVQAQEMTGDTLQGVKVTAGRRLLEAKKGKLVLNVDKSTAAAGSSAFDVLQRAPGISVDQNDHILLKGAGGVNVLLDGKMTYMSAQQLANVLKGMPAENIASIEIITMPGAEFDAAGNAGVINIITKKSNRPGYAVQLSSSLGAGHYLLHNQQITGNLRLQKMNFFGTLGYNQRKTFNTRSAGNSFETDTDTVYLSRLSLEPWLSRFYTYKAGADWYISNKHQLGFLYNGSLDDWSKDAGATTLLSSGGKTIQTIENRSVAIEPYYNNAFNLNYAYKYDTTGKKISVDADYISYRNHSDGFLANQSYNSNGMPDDVYQELRFRQPSYIKIRSVKADADWPMPVAHFKAGVKHAAVAIDNQFRYDSLLNHAYTPAESLSDYFQYTERISAAYASAERSFGKTAIAMGVRVEHTYTKGQAIHAGITTERNYTNLFPSFSVEQPFHNRHSLSFSLSRRINRPSYAELNPVRWYADKYSYYTGNPTLRPELTWLFALSYTLMNKYTATLSYNRLNHFISQTVVTDNVTGTVARQNANFSHQNRWDLLLLAPLRVATFWNLTATANPSYTAYPVMQKRGALQKSRIALALGLNQVFTLPAGIVLELNGRYSSGELTGIFFTSSYGMLDGGIKKSFLKNRFDLKLSFSDAFHTNRFKGYSVSDLSFYNYHFISDTRRVFITAVYRLGGKVNGVQNRLTDEQKRL